VDGRTDLQSVLPEKKEHQGGRPVSSSRRSKALTGPASPRRSVCAPGSMTFLFYRRPNRQRRQIMWLSSLLLLRSSSARESRSDRHRRSRPGKSRATSPPRVDALEDRLVPSLVAYYPAEGNANDMVGGHNGTLVGGTFGPGFQGTDQAFLLDGIDDYVQVPNAPTWNFGSKDFTIALWANFNALRPDDIGHPQAVFVGHDQG